ncbi:hypothetical protein PoB_004693100 [Plakobranchus ocellatus]|uniref:DUF19 domain-containing protein n=1 Tax=Plakobranchus ocellatus TaxID=259542 RepID=A0AAV4BAS2_9GAST|nr:hypothetical protein PoB_004693100 [Plakobranchus ocellatus]
MVNRLTVILALATGMLVFPVCDCNPTVYPCEDLRNCTAQIYENTFFYRSADYSAADYSVNIAKICNYEDIHCVYNKYKCSSHNARIAEQVRYFICSTDARKAIQQSYKERECLVDPNILQQFQDAKQQCTKTLFEGKVDCEFLESSRKCHLEAEAMCGPNTQFLFDGIWLATLKLQAPFCYPLAVTTKMAVPSR